MMEETIPNNLNYDSDSASSPTKPRRARVLSSSDEENEAHPTSETLKEITNNIETENTKNSSPVLSKSVNKFGFKSTLITDSDVEYDNDSEPGKSDAGGPENNLPYERENENSSLCEQPNAQTPEKPKKKKKKKSKKELNDKLAIRSETQRLEREQTVHLPYHRPKQRSLREFLSRKKNQINENSLRLSSPNMLHAWEEIDKSIKETAEFFKSESEDESEPKAETETHELTQTEENHIELTETVNEQVNEIEAETVKNNDNPEVISEVAFQEEEEKSVLEQEPLPDEVDAEETVETPVETVVDVPAISRKDKAAQWLDDIATYEKREALKNKLQLSPTILNKVPTLSNDLDDFVDFEESSNSEMNPGVKQLMDRMFKGLGKNLNASQQFLTTTYTEKDEFGNVKNIGVETTPIAVSPSVIVESEKPGVKRQLLKEKLRMEIEAKWEKEFKERCAHEPAKEGFEMETELSDELEEPEPEEEGSTTESESEPEEEENLPIIDKPRKFCAFGDSEAEESNDDDGCDGDDETEEDDAVDENPDCEPIESNVPKDEEEIDCSVLPAFQPGGGFSMGGSFLTQQSQPLPIKPTSPFSSPDNFTTKSNRDDEVTPIRIENAVSDSLVVNSSVKKNLFSAENVASNLGDACEDEPDDPFLFVSGAFPGGNEGLTSQSQPKRIILPDESEDSRGVESNHEVVADDDEKSTLRESAVLDDDDVGITVKKKNKQLVFSDDEEDEPVDKCLEEGVEENAVETNSADEPDVGIDDVNYDSEENEVRPGEFFDKEAELSESEWSGDEDEQGLDTLEAEAGDADVYDENQVASQLGRIHMRQVLDEDARNVRRLQELFFEDGDLYAEGGPRERNFRWKNLNGFDWNVHNGDDTPNGEVMELGDSAKLRFEKKQFLMKAQQEGKLQEVEEMSEGKSSVLVLGRQMMQKLQPPSAGAFATSKPQKQFPRGSFLAKDKSFLTRIVKTTAGGNDAPMLGASNSKNFTFAVQERIEEISTTYSEGSKRKAETCLKTVKRSKMMYQDSFLDQLRPTEATPHL